MKETLSKLTQKLSPLSLPLFFLALVFLDYALRFVYAGLGNTRLLSLRPMAFTLGWALLLTSLISLLPRLGRRIAIGLLTGLFGFLALLHGVMYNIFGHFFSFSDMSFAGDGAKFFSWSYLNLPKKYILFIGMFLVMGICALVLCGRPGTLGGRRWLRPGIALGLALLSIVPIWTVSVQLTPKESGVTWGTNYNPADEREIYKDFSDPNRSLKLTGLYQYTVRNLAMSLGWGVNRASIEELDAYFEQRAAETGGTNDFTGQMAGKSCIMVMLESVDTWMATPEYMPNLCRLQAEGVNFTNFYTPLFLSAGTFNTEIISQTGMVPPVTGVSASIYSTNQFPLSLANLFAREGYRVNSFHPANPNIYSRGSVHANLGFEAYHSHVDMGMEDFQMDSQMLKAYEQIAPQEDFFSFVITYSGHGPYTEELMSIAQPHLQAAERAVAAAGITGSEENLSEYTHAIAHAMETDQFIGGLVERLEAEGRLEDTLLVLYTDHYGKYMTDKEFLASVKGVEEAPDLYRTPCVMIGGGLAPAEVDKYCSSLDLAPTLVNLFGLDTDNRYYAGDDIFGDTPGVAMLPNNGWCAADGWFDGQGQDSNPERTAELRQRVNESMEAVRCDYFKGKEFLAGD